MLIFSKNKYISTCIKEKEKFMQDEFWVDDFDGKEVEQISVGRYKQVGGRGWIARPEWVAEVDDKYLGG